MENKVIFCLALHNHQPVGNFDHVFERAYSLAYAPFLQVLAKHPAIRLSIHISGPLMDWLDAHHPDYLQGLRRFVEEGRVEVLGGGYTEPILTIIPTRDAEAQLEWMSRSIEERFGARPTGVWLTERIWEPCLPELLESAGFEYTLLDESHFRSAGVGKDGVLGHYLSEKRGHKIHIFPIPKDLRYSIPFAEPARTIDILRRLARVAPGTCVTYGDDGEKFGMWPKTHEWVYERGWLDRFFGELTANADWIEFATLSEALKRVPTTGRVYLPATSYHEMTQWALPAEAGIDLERITAELKERNQWEDYERFIRGGFWDNFLAKYPESNRIHKRMLRVSDKLAKCPQDSVHTDMARRELFMGQCNCAYWHGLFGGLYLNYLRDALTRHLARAETYTDLLLFGGSAKGRFEMLDFDCDGNEEAILESPHYRAVIKPSDGAVLDDLVLVRYDFCLTNVLTRRPESYHEQVRQAASTAPEGMVSAHDMIVAKEEGLADRLIYDRLTRASFRDRFFREIPDFEAVYRERADEIGSFADTGYDAREAGGSFGPGVLCRTQADLEGEGSGTSIRIDKHFELAVEEPLFRVSYAFLNSGDKPLSVYWGVELNFTLLTESAPDRWIRIGDKKLTPGARHEGTASSLVFTDGWQGFSLDIDLDGPCLVRQYPIETVSQSESGFERIYQGTCIVAYRRLELSPGESAAAVITMAVREKE